jgi:hypothetical protein
MDLTQKKLSKSEWNNIEVPFPEEEKNILKMIINGYHNIDIKENNSTSIISLMKLDPSLIGIDVYLFKEYFEKKIKDLIKKYPSIIGDYKTSITSKNEKNKLRKKDYMRINIINGKMDQKYDDVFENIMIEYCTNILKYIESHSDKYAFYLYTLIQIKKASIRNINPHVTHFTDFLVQKTIEQLHMNDVLKQAYTFIEKNPDLLKYEDNVLYKHQKEIFNLFQYKYEKHQNELETNRLKLIATNDVKSKLVLYTAPTGTGKTLTPLGLSEGYRVIFICAARHVGLALAKSAVCMGKRIGIAFGCETADDIRLHYFAASEYSIHRRSGGIGKVDNSVGDKVQIMICDIKSYLISMHYMLAFTPTNPATIEIDCSIDEINHKLQHMKPLHENALKEENHDLINRIEKNVIDLTTEKQVLQDQLKQYKPDYDLITYWDEPTISMDYDDHPLHAQIKSVWYENTISKVVLSCATLPHEDDIQETLNMFQVKFSDAEINTITSFDCKKSIALLNQDCKSALPHLLYSNHDELQECVVHCNKNKSLLRYFDLVEIITFIELVHAKNAIPEHLLMENYFENDIANITMNSLKQYYLHLLKYVSIDLWNNIHTELVGNQKMKFQNSSNSKTFRSAGTTQNNPTAPANITGLHITTNDAQTLTDGPTIYLANNIENIGRYYIHKTNLPERVFNELSKRIAQNTVVQKELTKLETKLEELQEKKENINKDNKADNVQVRTKKKSKSSKTTDKDDYSPDIIKLNNAIDILQNQINVVSLDERYIPNSIEHQNVWHSKVKDNAYKPNICDEDVCEIMALDVDDEKKLLLLLGIGMFTDENTGNPRYMEIMKRLAYEQHLYVILASSDYIYGTNYQFCHGYIGKDLRNMTQQKTIQAMGRIGRNKMQQEYTIRFRDDNMLYQLFKSPKENKEANVMNRLFS